MLIVHRSNRTERLAADLAGLLRDDPPPSPFEGEVIAVQSRGMETWLAQRLSTELGVWANAEFPFPRTLVERLTHAALGDDPETGAPPDTSAFDVETLTWSTMAALPELLGEPAFDPLRSYLADDPRGLKRFQLARRIASTFDQYVVYRPEMVLGWQRGRENHWQAQLFRALVDNHGERHGAAVAERALGAMGAPARPELLPRRVSLFGLSTLPPLYLRLFAALPDNCPVHLFTLSPSPRQWSALQRRRDIIRARRDELSTPDETVGALDLPPGHPLLASLGVLGREFQLLLEGETTYEDPGDAGYEPPANGDPRTLLQVIQAQVFGDEPPRACFSAAQLAGDRSISVHACHAPRREIEVLHTQLQALFDDDEALQPRDVIVMMPDVEAYAPLIEAVFGARSPAIPYRISDRSVRSETPVIDAFGALLALARGRLEAPQVMDLLAMGPVRARFGLDTAAVDQIREWVRASGARWGIDAAHRQDQGLPPLDDHTWRFGLDRLLLGYAQPAPRLFAGRMPLDTAEGSGAAVLGGLAAFADTLFGQLRALEAPRTAAAWSDHLELLLGSMLHRDRDTEHQHQLIRDALVELADGAAAAGVDDELDLDVIRAWLTERFDLSASAHGFLSGGVTFCNLLPMRSIPFEVVCLAGMQDGAFPRSRRVPGFDLTARDPRLGDRSGRADDRQLFLEALLSARRALIVTYVGRGVRDNADLPPSVVISELLDVIDQGLAGDEFTDAPNALDALKARDARDARDARELLVLRHPMQPFSPVYFGDETRLFSYDQGYRDGAAAMGAERADATPFMSAALAGTDEGGARVSLDRLARFWCSPGDDLLRGVLGVDLSAEVDELEQREPIDLDGLEAFTARTELLQLLLDDGDAASAWPLLRGTGALPHGTAGRCLAEDLVGQVSPIAERARDARDGHAPLDPIDLELELGPAVLVGRIGDLWPSFRLVVTAGELHERRRIEAWIRHLALNAAAPDHPRRTVLIGRRKGSAATIELAPVDDARAQLGLLLRWFALGQRWPLAFFPAASLAYVTRILAGDGDAQAEQGAVAAARAALRGNDWARGEAAGAGLERLWYGLDPLDEGTAPPAPSGGGAPLEVPGFRALAHALWEPLLAAEEVPR